MPKRPPVDDRSAVTCDNGHVGTPEQDLTPEEINDPQMMQLWVAPYGTPLPAAWDGAVDMAFRFVGMIRRDVKATAAVQEGPGLFGARWETGPPVLTLTWHRMLAKHAAVLPVRTYCSVLFGLSAERQLGVAPRVALKDFEANIVDEGASCTAVVERDPTSGMWMTWHVAPPLMAVAK